METSIEQQRTATSCSTVGKVRPATQMWPRGQAEASNVSARAVRSGGDVSCASRAVMSAMKVGLAQTFSSESRCERAGAAAVPSPAEG